MNAGGFSPEERAQVEADYKRVLREGIPGEAEIGEMRQPTGQDRTDVMARLTGVTSPTGQPTAYDRPGWEDESFALKAARRAASRASAVAGAISYPFEEVGAGAGDVASRIAQSAGVPESVAGPASRFFVQGPIESLPYLPLVEAMPWMRAGKAAADAGAPVAQTALQHAGTVLRGVLGRTVRPAAAGAVIEPGLRTVGRFGAGQPTTAEDVANEAAQGGAGFATGHLVFGEAIPGALEALRGMRGGPREGPRVRQTYTIDTPGGPATVEYEGRGPGPGQRRGPSVAPLNESGAAEPGTGTGSTPPGPGGTELPSSEASDQARWVEGETEEGTGAGSTPPRPATAVSPASAGGPALDEAGVSTTFGMGLMTALQDELVEPDGTGRFTVTDAGLQLLEGRGAGGEQGSLEAQMAGAQRLPVPSPEENRLPPQSPVAQSAPAAGRRAPGLPIPTPEENAVANIGRRIPPGPLPPAGATPIPPGALPQAGVPSLADLVRSYAQPEFPARAPLPPQLPAVVPGEDVRTSVEPAGIARPLPEEAIPAGVRPAGAPPPAPPGPQQAPLPARPEGIAGAPPSPELPSAAGAAGAAGAPSPDVMENLLAAAQKAAARARTPADKQFYQGQATALEQILRAMQQGEPPGKAVAVAGAAPGPPPSEPPAARVPATVSPIRPTLEEPPEVARPPVQPVEAASTPPVRPAAPPRPVESPPAPGRGAAPGEEVERPPTREEHVAELLDALKDAQREMATEQNPRGQPLSGEEVESAHRFAAELEQRLRALGVEPPGMPVLAPERPSGAIRSEPEPPPPTPTPPEAPARPQALAGPAAEEQGVLGRPSPAPTPEAQPVSVPRKALVPPTPSGAETARTGTPEAGPVLRGELGKPESVRAEIPVTPGPKKGKGKGTTLASGLGGLGEFGTSAADRAARADADALRRDPAVAKTLAHIGEPEAAKRWTFGEFYRRVFDNLDPVKRAVKELQEKPPAERDPYVVMRLYRGWLGKARNWIESAPRDYATGARVADVKPLAEILRPVEADRDLFDAFLHARHALELHELGKESGLAPDVARETIARLDSPRFRQAADNLYAYQRALLDYTQEFNTPERRARMKELYPLYVPYDRFLAEGGVLTRGPAGGAKFVNVADPVRRLEGSERPITSPTETILRNTYALIKAAEQNRAGLTLAETLGRAPETTRLVERLTSKVAEEARGDEPIVQVYSRGKRVFLRLDPILHQAVLGLDQAPLSTLERLLALPATLLRKTATITPEFIPKNWTRDQYTAFITAGVHPLQSIRGIAHALGRDATYYDWLQSGGAQAGWVSLERSAVSDKLGEVLRNPNHRLQAGMLLKPWQMLGALSELVEEGTRIGAYEKAARAEHGPEAPPLRRQVTGGFASREATVDFSRIGASVHGLNAIVAFQNAAFQGVDRIVRAAKDNPARTMARIAAVVTLPSVYLWFANHEDPEYRELPQWEKDAFWHVKAGGRFFRIPKPWVEGVLFGSLPERFLDDLDRKDPAVFRRWASGAAGAVFPNMVPTFANPLIENYANWSTFKDRPIVPRGLEGVEPREQATPYTSLFARKLGGALNYAPAKIDNLIQGYTGGLGVLTTQGVDALLREASPPTGGEPPTATAADIPGLRAFVSRYPTMQAQSVQDFYDLYAKAGEKSRTYKLLERQDPTRAEAYAKANPEVFRMTGLAQVAKGLAANSRLLSGINGDASLTGDQKRAAIDATTLESIHAAARAIEVSRQPPTPLARMQERGAQARDAREQALRAVERGAVHAATGGGSEALRQALLDMARKGAPVSSEDVSRRLKSPTFLHEVLTERLRRAPTPEERARARAVLDRLTQAQAVESLRRLPKFTRGAMVAP